MNSHIRTLLFVFVLGLTLMDYRNQSMRTAAREASFRALARFSLPSPL